MSPGNDTKPSSGDEAARRALLRACAYAQLAELRHAVEACGSLPATVELRKPEQGLVMLRGRIGGDGAPFNLGEATVTRASVRLASGQVGHGHVLGRNAEKARLAALIDALGQIEVHRCVLEAELAGPVAARLAGEHAERAALTAATRVNFFTLVRGDD